MDKITHLLGPVGAVPWKGVLKGSKESLCFLGLDFSSGSQTPVRCLEGS